ncbi:MAG: thioredoxin-like domain-containing protein [Bdellovibrionales bacterium]
MKKGLVFILAILLSNESLGLINLSNLKGTDLLTNRKIIITPEENIALVVLFLSAKCPCSNSHINEIKNLSQEYSDFTFIAVHSNVDESPEVSKNYFQNIGLGFDVIDDNLQVIANQYKAYKTPHAFVVRNNGELAYQGGVSNSNDFGKSDKKFLREALSDIKNNRKVRTPEGRTLGCAINRRNQNVW